MQLSGQTVREDSTLFRTALFAAFTLMLAGCAKSPDPGVAVVRGVNFVGMSVADLDRSAEFYANATAMSALELSGNPQGSGLASLSADGRRLEQERMLRSSNAQLRLMQFAGPHPAGSTAGPAPVNGPGIAHVCFQVNKETGAYQRFLASGATPIGSPEMIRLSSRNPVEYAYVHDHDGIVFEVEHVDVAALDLEQPPANDYRIRHVSLATGNMDALLAFYSRLLGDQKPRRIGRFFSISGEKVDQVSGLPGSKLKMSWFQVRNLELEIVQYLSHPPKIVGEPRPVSALGYNVIVFDVSDLEGARQLLLTAGGAVVSEVTAMDGGEVFFGRDPDGNLLGFQKTVAQALVSSQNFTNNGLQEN